ncbi:MAG: hypothetical protein LBS80_06310 [Tannerella sp.]|nr:hypothetical protein [Tannerella sp.]
MQLVSACRQVRNKSADDTFRFYHISSLTGLWTTMFLCSTNILSLTGQLRYIETSVVYIIINPNDNIFYYASSFPV